MHFEISSFAVAAAKGLAGPYRTDPSRAAVISSFTVWTTEPSQAKTPAMAVAAATVVEERERTDQAIKERTKKRTNVIKWKLSDAEFTVKGSFKKTTYHR